MARLTNKQRTATDIAVCMTRAARSSGVPFAKMARAAKAARKAFAELKYSTWIGAVSGDCNDSRNWLYGRLPRKGDSTIVFDGPGNVNENMDFSRIPLDIWLLPRPSKMQAARSGSKGERCE